MSLEHLSEPLSGDLPAGVDCQPEMQEQNFALMYEYIAERAVQRGRERSAEAPGLEEDQARNAAALRDDGARRLSGLEGILKDVIKVSAVNAEQVAGALRDKSSALLAQRGKDLRLVAFLGAACTVTDGLEGYVAALKLGAALLQAYPADLFPLPDEDDPTDFWERANAVSDLVSNDGIRALLSSVVIIDARQSGRLTLADLVGELHNDIPAVEVSQTDLDMALSEVGPERVQQVLAELREIETSIASLIAALGDGSLSTPRLADAFKRAVVRIAAFAEGGTSGETSTAAGSEPASGGAAVNTQGGLRTREDARQAIQDVIRFIEKLEPSHPAPLLLKRADRLLGMSFFEIMRDMAPSALSDIERIVGTESSE